MAMVRETAGCDSAEQSGALGHAAGLDDRRKLDKMAFIELHNDMVY